MFGRKPTTGYTGNSSDNTDRLQTAVADAEAVVIGAGAGLSVSAGFVYSGERFNSYFSDFEEKYGFHDMYSGCFYPYPTPEETWAFWSRFIYINRYMDPPKPVYEELLELVRDKDHFVITTNVDHCFQKAGVDKHKLFYTQGDYGLWQCSRPCHYDTYDNEETVKKMVLSQGYTIGDDGALLSPESGGLSMEIPSELIPRCPKCGEPMSMNLRSDMTFVEDEGWHVAAGRYSDFLRRHINMKTLFLDVGTGFNTPTIFKMPFWQMTGRWPDALYACINLGEAYAPDDIKKRSICIDCDAGEVLSRLK